MLAVGPLQSAPEVAGGGLLAFVVTFLVAWVFYSFTLHLAATFFVGDVPTQPAAAAAFAPAITSVLIIRYPPAVILAVTVAVDAAAIRWSYDLDLPGTVAVTLLHLAFTTILAVALNNLLGFI